MQPDTFMKVVAVKFGKSDKTYDYLATGFDVSVGQHVMVKVRDREMSVEVIEVKPYSEVAITPITRIDVRTDEQREAKHANGMHRWAPDGTEIDEEGNTITEGEPA